MNPDWMLYSGKFLVDSEKAKAQNSVFRIMNIPLLYLPYVTHPMDSEGRQSGFLIPIPGYSSTKGFTFGEQYTVEQLPAFPETALFQRNRQKPPDRSPTCTCTRFPACRLRIRSCG